MRQLVLILCVMASEAIAAPPDLQEGRFTYDFLPDSPETVYDCGSGTLILTWGIHSYVLQAEGDHWVHPQLFGCQSEGACSAAYRLIGPDGRGYEQARATPARKAMADYPGPGFRRNFGWETTPGPVNAARKARACAKPRDWLYIPPED
ncbi:MAG: hypothetical protein AAGM84_00270 [Pseudomonadota bacterium]